MIRGGHTKTYSSGESLDSNGKNEADKLLDQLLKKAIKQRASSVHIEPSSTSVVIRYRIDGSMIAAQSVSKHLHSSLARSAKGRAGLDNQIRQPQQASFSTLYDKIPYVIQVVTMPINVGEIIVLHITNPSATDSLESEGFWGESLRALDALAAKQRGLIVITGGTGSGSPKTIAALTDVLAHPAISLVTIHATPGGSGGINGLSPHAALKLALKQNPDVIVIENIRSKLLFQAVLEQAKTKLVIASVTALDTITLLAQVHAWSGHERALSAQLLLGVVEQRLVPTLCTTCREKFIPSKQVIQKLITAVPDLLALISTYETSQSLPSTNTLTPFKKTTGGCKACNKTGTTGQITVNQVTTTSNALQQFLLTDSLASAKGHLTGVSLAPVSIATDMYVKASTGTIAWPSMKSKVYLTIAP